VGGEADPERNGRHVDQQLQPEEAVRVSRGPRRAQREQRERRQHGAHGDHRRPVQVDEVQRRDQREEVRDRRRGPQATPAQLAVEHGDVVLERDPRW